MIPTAPLTGKPGGRSQAVTRPCPAIRGTEAARPGVGSRGRCPLLAHARRYPAAAEIGLDESALPLKLSRSEGLKIASGL